VRQHQPIVVCMRIDEAGRDDPAAAVDLDVGALIVERPMEAMRPFMTAMSAAKRGVRMPSITVPLRMSRSYFI